MKAVIVLQCAFLLGVTACAHHGHHDHHGGHKNHPYTHNARDHAAHPDPAPSRDYTETYSAPVQPAVRYATPAPDITYSKETGKYSYDPSARTAPLAPSTTYSYGTAPATSYTYSSQSAYATAPSQSYVYTSEPPPVEAAVTGPDTRMYVPGDSCMNRHANASGPLHGNLTGGTRYTCSGGPVATSGGVSYPAQSYNYGYSSSYAYSSAPATSYTTQQPAQPRYTYIPGQPSSGVTDPPLQGAPDVPSAKPQR